MAETLHDFSTAVENLLTVNRDAEQGFRSAADAVGDPELKRMFVELSTQRGKFTTELQEAVRKLGFEPPNPLGTAGTIHGAWIAIKSTFSGHKAHPVLEEAERGEDHSIKTYRESLAMILQTDVRSIIERQLESIEQSHERIRVMRDQTAPPPPPAPQQAAPEPAPREPAQPEPVAKS